MKRAAALTFTLLAVGLAISTGVVGSNAAAVCDPGAFLLRSTGPAADSSLWRYDPETDSVTEIVTLTGQLNAMAAKDGDFYAIARPPARAVHFGTDGVLHDLGPITGAPAGNFASAYSGDIEGDNWYLVQDSAIYTVSLSSLTVTAVAPVSGIDIGDLAAYKGQLFALSTIGTTDLLKIDPATGAVTLVSEPAGLPAGSSFGAMWMIDNYLYTLHNGTGQLFRIDLENPETALPVGTGGLNTDSSDGAACPAPPPPASPSPSPSPSMSPSPSPTPSPSTSPSPSASPSPSPSATPSASEPPSTSPSPSPPPMVEPSPVPPPVAVPPAPAVALPPPAPEPQPARVAEPTPPAPPTPARSSARPASRAPVPAEGIPVEMEKRRALVAAPLPDRTKTRRWVAAGAVALGLGGILGFIGVNRSRS